MMSCATNIIVLPLSVLNQDLRTTVYGSEPRSLGLAWFGICKKNSALVIFDRGMTRNPMVQTPPDTQEGVVFEHPLRLRGGL